MESLPNGVRELRSKEPVFDACEARDDRHLDLAIRLPCRNLRPHAEFHLGDRVESAPAIRWASDMTDRTTES